MNPINLAQEIEDRYRRYLKTTFYFRDAVLRASFEDALRSGRLSKGPFLEATPIFSRSSTPQSLFPSVLGLQPEPGFLKAVHGERPLYVHQEKSIRGVFADRNVVVATGTGSGKTEAFLYPILLHLYREYESGTLCPGVRALVLYPMNALANDQRERLGEICKTLADENSAFRFTFGQYIGETPENENDSRRHARDHLANKLPGELVLRSEMRTTPPHILLTNYSMLEYLLLRPDDSPLFDDGRAEWWKFLVLDEAHQYRGAKGIEMAMLLRRLKQRLREGGRAGVFRCLATSATLVGGKEGEAAVAKFAPDLFGEPDPFEVIFGDVEGIPEPSATRLGREDYQSLSLALDGTQTAERLAGIVQKLGAAVPETDETAKAIGSLLQQDGRTTQLRRLVTGKPAEVKAIAEEIFPDLPEEERADGLTDLVALLLRAKVPASGAPLLSARYHLFLRSLEGAFLSFTPSKTVLLDRRSAGEAALFEVGLCRECGQHYLVGRTMNDKLLEAVRDPSRADFGASFFLPMENGPVEDEDEDENGAQTYRLCGCCGEIRRLPEQLRCNHNVEVLLQKQEGEEGEDKIPRCGVCGYQGRDPVREVVHGTDGPHAVIATTLYQNLPDPKKVLAFADGRQEAAFFAWYLDDSYKAIRGRNLLLEVAQAQSAHSQEGSSLKDLATALRGIFRQRNVFPPATSDLQLRREAWLALYREFLTDEPRISLDGVGLTRWFIKWPDWFHVPQFLRETPWSLTEQQARDLIFLLVDSMRTDRAVEVRTDDTVSLNWSDFQLQASQMRFRIGRPARPTGAKGWPVRSWDAVDQWGRVRHTKRTAILEKLLPPDLADEQKLELAVAALRQIWEAIGQCDAHAPTSNDRLLIAVEDARRLNPDWWRLRHIANADALYRCDTCGRIQAVSVKGLCPRHRCPGVLKETRRSELEANHYRLLYESELPGSLRVEEHTAQLDKEKAREFQREFRDGKIHVLSCSTTFELGVDLGDLDTIFLRNVPPEAFNYAQRVGRSGRRSGRPGFAITYCKRGPHDLYHFAEPLRMLTGKVQPPVLALRNERIITRHVAAVALSLFFRQFKERFPEVQSLFTDLSSPSALRDFRSFLLSNREHIEQRIAQILPSEMEALADGRWVDKIAGENTRFALAEAEVSSDFKTVIGIEETARNSRPADYKTAAWAQRRAETIAKETVLSFLSRKAVIPKYGFPVDVVELDTQRTQQSGHDAYEVSLQRDLAIAISEFAPTSKLVANKKEWTSYGLKKVAEREWPRKFYARCSTHNVFLQWNDGDPKPTMPCGDRLLPHKYVIPAFGFVTDRDKPKDPKARPAKVFSTRPYFARSLATEPGVIPMPAASPLATVIKASPGLMVVICEGRGGEGFYLCGGCGAGFRKRQNRHKSPQGQQCSGTLEQVSLGHEFVTDVLQLQFHPAPPNGTIIVPFAFSLAYAVVEGAAEVLEVPSLDLSTTVHSGQHAIPPIILYDNVPGGAGLVARLEQEAVLRTCLQAALKRVEGGCGCAPNTSCYGCLRSYRNQFAHEILQRGPVQQYLQSILSVWGENAASPMN